MLDARSPWLRVHLDGTARCTIDSATIGDAAAPEALALRAVQLRWRLRDLVHAHWLPSLCSVERIDASLHNGPDGAPCLFSTLQKRTPGDAHPDTTAVPFPNEIPASILPQIGHALRCEIAAIDISLPKNLPVQEAGVRAFTLTLSRPNSDLIEAHAGINLHIDDRTATAELSAQLSLVRDWIGQLRTSLSVEASDAAPRTEIAIEATRMAADEPVKLELRIQDFAPDEWLPLLPLKAPLSISGRLGLRLQADGDLATRQISSAQLALSTTALTVQAPAHLVQPLNIEPITLSGSVSEQGAKGEIAPFTLIAGPIDLRCTGLSWDTSDQSTIGTGKLTLAERSLTSLTALLPSEISAQIPLTAEERNELGLTESTVELHLLARDVGKLPHVTAQIQTGVILNRGQIALSAAADFDPATQRIQAQLHIPDFVAAQWQLAALQRLPTPDVDAPMSAEFTLRAQWPDHLEEATWSIVAGPGHLRPHGASAQWLAHPFPISSFALSGRIDESSKHLSIDRLNLVSGRARLGLARIDLRSAQSILNATGPSTTAARFEIELSDWYASDFIPLLGPSLQPFVTPYVDDLAQVGLERLVTTADVTFSTLPWVEPTLATMQSHQSAVFRIGDERVPIDVEWKLDPVSRRVLASAGMHALRLDRLALPSLVKAGLPLGAIDLPVSVEAELSANPLAKSLADMDAKARLRFTAAPGRIKANPWLGADLPLVKFDCTLAASIHPLAIERLHLETDFGGPALLIDDARLWDAKSMTGALHLQIRQLPIDWAYERIPATYLPQALAGVRLQGQLDRLDLRTEFRATPEQTVPMPTALKISATGHAIGVALPSRPPIAIDDLTVDGTLDRIAVRIGRASTTSLVLHEFDATILDALQPARRVSASGRLAIDLGQVVPALKACHDLVPLPIGLDLSQLAGHATASFTAEAPLDAEALARHLHAQTEIFVHQLAIPMLPEGLALGKSELEIAAEITGTTLQSTHRLKPEKLEYSPWFSGAASLQGKTTITPECIVIDERLDLQPAEIIIPELCWSKPRGLAAGVDLNATFRPVDTSHPATLAARIETHGLVCSPLRTNLDAVLSDVSHPEIPLVPGIADLVLADMRLGQTQMDVAIQRSPNGVSSITIKSPLLELADWARQLAPAIERYSLASAQPTAGAGTTNRSPAAGAPIHAAAQPLPALNLPPVDLRADFSRIRFMPSHEAENVSLRGELRNGYLACARFSATAGDLAKIEAQLENADTSGRQPWSLYIGDFSTWFRTLSAPIALIPEASTPPESSLASLRTMPPALLGGHVAAPGTLAWADSTNTLIGSAKIDRLTLQQEIEFLRKIAALVKRRVLLQIPFETFEIQEFRANPDFIALRDTRIVGPLDVTASFIHLDLAQSFLDMSGKVLGIGFEVTGPFDEPHFYLSEKNQLVKGITTEDDFDWSE